MSGAPLPHEESRRLLDLARYQILDSAPEVDFDRITRLAARVLNVPVAVLNLIDQHRQWGKAVFGLDDSTAPRADSFCAWTILGDDPFVVDSAPHDPRFQNNPMVTGTPHIHMYAGVPLITPAGHRIGSLCVTDSEPHPLAPEDVQALSDLAALAMQTLELRRQTLEAQQNMVAQQQEALELRRTLDQARILDAVNRLVELDFDPVAAPLAAASLLSEALETDYTALLHWTGDTYRVEGAHHRPGAPAELLALKGGLPALGGVSATLRDLKGPLSLNRYASHPAAIPELVTLGVTQVTWMPLGQTSSGPLLLMTLRLRDNPVTAWRPGDQALLAAVGRTIRYAVERHTALQVVRREARRDALTGLYNRRAFEEDLTEREGAGAGFTLALIDLDGLKGVNDSEGHAQGDRLLQVFGTALGTQGAEHCAAYRLGGDEFALLLPEQSEDELLRWVHVAIGAARRVSLRHTGASTGVAHSHEARGQALVALADGRMYEAKRRKVREAQNIR
ncbi:sensor domain-containing diguanylate cyclase [Deinococcus taeanensis]|uniref:sensor domain-containing diguanylate cyclase n=1 Tax=Deinococcus taeanensis TaxID=2737050 RepID=UPI0025595E6D|nr:sensor domain-containing diguanylate cyclase [Deinococcus taeanensis]